MPIYIVRYPILQVALVRAANDSELELMLDQIDDPTIFEWKEYRGPLWINLKPPVKFEAHYRADKRPMAADEFELKGVKALARKGWHLEAYIGETEEAGLMEEAVTKFAFPSVSKMLDEVEPESPLEKKALEKHIKADIVATEWRRSTRFHKLK